MKRRIRGFSRGFWLLAALLPCGCATLASEAGDDDAVRPNNLAGPFRYLVRPELASNAPYTLRRRSVDHRDATLLPLDGERVALYAAANVGGVSGIYRFIAEDGRSFIEQPDPQDPVLAAREAWEGATLEAPSVLRVGAEVWLAYAGTDGIGIARSSDGVTFTNATTPVLSTQGGSAWEAGATPQGPALTMLGASDFRLFYGAGGSIGEATSSDGLGWTRTGAPVLEPSAGEAFDAAGVSDPEPWLAKTAEGRRVLRLYYAGRDAAGVTGIGLAARYADSGAMQKNPQPALSGPRLPRAPAVLPRDGYTLLFITQRAGSADDEAFPALAVGIAPATLRLPAAAP